MTAVRSFRDAERGLGLVQSLANAAQRWKLVRPSAYTSTPASTSTISIGDVSWAIPGTPIRYAQGGTTYYGLISTAASRTLTIVGAPLSTSYTLEGLWLGKPEMAVGMNIFVAGAYGAGVQDGINWFIGNRYYEWDMAPANLVGFRVIHKTDDTGANQPKVNVSVNGNKVSTKNSNAGIAVTNTGWSGNGVDVSVANYRAVRGVPIAVDCGAAGTNGNAADLSVELVFVME